MRIRAALEGVGSRGSARTLPTAEERRYATISFVSREIEPPARAGSEDPTATMDPSDRRSEARPTPEPSDRFAAAAARIPARYEVVRVLGAGASGVVFEANDGLLERRVAIKVVDRESALLVREARAAAALRHPNVIGVHEADPVDGYFVMELAPKGSLEARLKKGTTLSARETVALGVALAGALETAHRAGILHRDVKPSNVLLAEDGSPRLADFGVAQIADADGRSVGTLAYAAPEQMCGRADARSDVFGLGATLLRAATGKRISELRALGESTREAIRARTRDDRLAQVVERMLEEDPARRQSSAAEARDMLLALGRTRRMPAFAVVISIALLLGAGILVLRAQSVREAEARALEQATLAVERHDLDAAERWLASCGDEDPDAAYLRVLVHWWRGHDRSGVRGDIDRALALDLEPAHRRVLEGIRLLVTDRPEAAVDHFTREVRRPRPRRDALYGLFEAQWHTGRTAEALETHRRIETRDPDFVLGLEHVLSHHLAHGHLSEVDRILARSGSVPSDERALWAARGRFAAGEYDLAIRELVSITRDRDLPRVRAAALALLAQAQVVRGDLDDARRTTRRMQPLEAHFASYAIEVIDGDPRAISRTRRALRREIARHRSYVVWSGFVSFELARGDSDAVADALRGFEVARKDDVRTRMIDLLAAHLRGDRRAIEAALDNPSAEVREAARALVEEQRGNGARAAISWERAAERSNDGVFRAYELHAAARLHHGLHDHAAVIRTCDEVVRPHVASWGAIPNARQCSSWLAEAHDALAQTAGARRAREHLARLDR
jgi:eukaryotic-like serine/threonine-protein kinase